MNEAGYSIYIAKLIAKQALGRATEAEDTEIRLWVSLSDANKRAYEDLLDAEKQRIQYGRLHKIDSGEAFRSVQARYHRHTVRRRLIRFLPYAAAIILLLSVGIWFSNSVRKAPAIEEKIAATDVLPGGNRATLTLADGRMVDLSEIQNGIVIGTEDITYQDGTSLGVTPSEQLVLTTPRGGTYQVTLPDASIVWLNASSTLKYPSRFDKKERVVELAGEAYFEVKPVKAGFSGLNIPFKVMTADQTVEVLGTQFNISAYLDDVTTKTTLVEGAVRLGSNGTDVTLSPGEQGVLSGGEFRVAAVDVADFVGWKKGDFIFNGIQLRDAMKQLSRWYDVEIVYEDEIPQMQFYGSFSRSSTLAEALDILEEAKVNFTVLRVGTATRVVVKL